MARPGYVIYNLRDTYHELGDYEFKIVLDPRTFKNGHLSEVECFNSDGKKLEMDVQKWGRKVNCSFKIDHNVPDGVCVLKMNLRDDAKKELNCRATFWVIK